MLKKQATTRDYHERNRRVAAFRVGDFFAARVVRLLVQVAKDESQRELESDI